MELNGLGAISSALDMGSKVGDAGKSEGGFAALFSNLIDNHSKTAKNSSLEQQPTDVLTDDELAGLLDFLQKNDILDLDNGQSLLEKVAFQSNTNILDIIKEQLNLSSDELFGLLSKLYAQLSPNDMDDQVQGKIVSDKLVNEMNIEEMLARLIEAILSLLVQNLTVKPDKDFGQAMKILKLFELLSANKDAVGDQSKLLEFMRIMSEKLEQSANQSIVSSRQDFLQKTFHSLLGEMNGKSAVQAEKSGESSANVTSKTELSNQGFMQFQQMSRPEQLTLLTNSPNKTVSAEELMKQFENILARSQFTKAGGTQRLFIKLNPEHLGALRVELIQKDSAIVARILTSTSLAKEMMESQLNGLKQAFSSQNIQVEKVEISQQFTQQERTFNRGEEQEQEKQQGRQHEETTEKQTSEFTDSFEEALLNIEV